MKIDGDYWLRVISPHNEILDRISLDGLDLDNPQDQQELLEEIKLATKEELVH